jgi:hypothetical protein
VESSACLTRLSLLNDALIRFIAVCSYPSTWSTSTTTSSVNVSCFLAASILHTMLYTAFPFHYGLGRPRHCPSRGQPLTHGDLHVKSSISTPKLRSERGHCLLRKSARSTGRTGALEQRFIIPDGRSDRPIRPTAQKSLPVPIFPHSPLIAFY